jgi:hypothetical protein
METWTGLAGILGSCTDSDVGSSHLFSPHTVRTFNRAGVLSRYVGRHVVERTGISGEFALAGRFACITAPHRRGALAVRIDPNYHVS